MNAQLGDLLQKWRVLVRVRPGNMTCRPLAGLGWLYDRRDYHEGFVALRDLKAVVLHDEPHPRGGWADLRLAGYRLELAPTGVELGGAARARFEKNLRMEPRVGAHGPRIDLAGADLLPLALRLHRQLRQVEQYRPNFAKRLPKFPRFWAGFAPAEAASLVGSGPELTAISEKFDLSPKALLDLFRRDHWNLACYPLEWIGSQATRALQLFADLTTVPQAQVFRLDEYPADLIGQRGHVHYDFYHSRLRRQRQTGQTFQSARPARIAA